MRKNLCAVINNLKIQCIYVTYHRATRSPWNRRSELLGSEKVLTPWAVLQLSTATEHNTTASQTYRRQYRKRGK